MAALKGCRWDATFLHEELYQNHFSNVAFLYMILESVPSRHWEVARSWTFTPKAGDPKDVKTMSLEIYAIAE